MRPLVVITVLGGVVDHVAVNGKRNFDLRIVDWDDLNDEDICCPECGSTDLHADTTTKENYFLCDECNARFLWKHEWERP